MTVFSRIQECESNLIILSRPGTTRLRPTSQATAFAGGSVQHGVSAAGGIYGFYEHCSAADKR